MKVLQGLLLLAFLAVIGLFAVQNTGAVTVHFWHYALTSSLALVIAGVYVLGMLTGWVVVAFLTRSVRRVMEHDREEAYAR